MGWSILDKITIHQITATVSFGDAISNEILAIKKMLDNMGIHNEIYAENIDPRVKKYVKKYTSYKGNKDDIIINHFGIGSSVNDYVIGLKNKVKIIRYHNITPHNFFHTYNSVTAKLCELGREQLKKSRDTYKYSLAVSEYNKQELLDIGYKNISIMPIIIAIKDYEKKPNDEIVNKFNDNNRNIIFVGRVSPNKKQEDVIKSFYYYKKYFNSKSRLFIVGSYDGMELYYKQLIRLIQALELEDVFFTGHTSFESILAYYSIADLFLCMSEHEGFCVPLVESMFFKVPVLAYNSSAIPDTLSGSSVLINEKNYEYIAGMMNYILEEKDFRDKIINKQSKRLEELRPETVELEFEKYIKKIIGDI